MATGALNGKVALVTGASRGIGRAIAVSLAEQGAIVAAHYGSDSAAADETVRAINDRGGTAFRIGADLADPQSIRRFFDTLDQELMRRDAAGLDILVNNAGIGTMAALRNTDQATYDRLFEVNTRGPFFVTQAALPRLREGGRVINISSMVSLAAYPECIAYAMTKAAVNAFTRSLAKELGPRGITVNAVAPGATKTDFISDLSAIEGFMDAISAQTALGRIGEARDIADVVSWLASPSGCWITGQVIQASGGMHL